MIYMSNAHVISKVWTTTKVCLFSISMLKNASADYFSSYLINLLHEIYMDSLRALSYAWEVYKLSIALSHGAISTPSLTRYSTNADMCAKWFNNLLLAKCWKLIAHI